MRGVVRAMLEGMPEPSCLHLERAGGRCLMMVGSAVLAEYAEADTVMRNFAVTVARSSGFSGKRVAEVFGLSAAYVSTLHAAARREGSAALVRHAGRPGRAAGAADAAPGAGRHRRPHRPAAAAADARRGDARRGP